MNELAAVLRGDWVIVLVLCMGTGVVVAIMHLLVANFLTRWQAKRALRQAVRQYVREKQRQTP